MTIEEAIKEKSRMGETIIIDDMEFKVVIAPLREKDYNMFLETYRGEEITDEHVSSYSVDQKYRVCALKVINGFDIVGKTLKV